MIFLDTKRGLEEVREDIGGRGVVGCQAIAGWDSESVVYGCNCVKPGAVVVDAFAHHEDQDERQRDESDDDDGSARER